MSQVYLDAVKSEVRNVIMNQKANAVPISVRLAWHASGTFDKSDGTGGSDGATMRFEPESTDGANAGLSIPRDLLKPVKDKFPELSIADIWVIASCAAIEFAGGPRVPFRLGRKDDTDGRRCPANGRLPDAAQGAQHLRDVFYRMGFNDKDIVALSGAHTLGRCHVVRSGFDGPWTRNPLKFDNAYFKLLINLEWKEKQWDGPKQFVDADTEEIMMLPTDMALKTDAEFRKHAEVYAKDEQAFFNDFADAYARLLALGCPAECDTTKRAAKVELTDQQKAGLSFRENAMHGSVGLMERYAKDADIHELEANSGRTALHKAAFWGHDGATEYLLGLGLKPDVQDYNGDTALHDAARFGHSKVVALLVKAGASQTIKNKLGQTPAETAAAYGYPKLAAL